MEKVWKDMLSPGRWHLRDGRVFECKREDIPVYAKSIKECVLSGLPVPVCWDHRPGLTPKTLEETYDQNSEVSKFTFAHIQDVKVEDETIFVQLDVKDPKDEEQLKKTKFVSPSLALSEFTDPRGKVWPAGTVLHIACTSIPIQDTGQKAFGEVTDGASLIGLSGTVPKEPINLSGAQFEPLEKKMDEEKKEEKKEKTPEGSEIETIEETEKGVDVPKLIEELAHHGLILPDDTTAENFLDRLNVACITAKHHKDGGKEETPDTLNPDKDTISEAPMPSPVMMGAIPDTVMLSGADYLTLKKNADGFKKATKDKEDSDKALAAYRKTTADANRNLLARRIANLKPFVGDKVATKLSEKLRLTPDTELCLAVDLSAADAPGKIHVLEMIQVAEESAQMAEVRKKFLQEGDISLSGAPTMATFTQHEAGAESVTGITDDGTGPPQPLDQEVMDKLSGGRWKPSTNGK
jgi:hypothetical protein